MRVISTQTGLKFFNASNGFIKLGFFFDYKVGQDGGLKEIVSRIVSEVAVVVVALPIFKALRLNLTWLLFFGVIEFFMGRGNISAVFNDVGNCW